MVVEIGVGDYINGYKICSIHNDPFVKGQIDLLTDGIEKNWQGDMSTIIFRLKKPNKTGLVEWRDDETKEFWSI